MRPRRRRPELERTVPRKRDERINEEIRVPRVRLVDEKGGQVGIIPTKEALEFAYGKGLDLSRSQREPIHPWRGYWTTRSTATSRNSARSRPESTSSRSTSRRSSSGRRSGSTTTRPRRATSSASSTSGRR